MPALEIHRRCFPTNTIHRSSDSATWGSLPTKLGMHLPGRSPLRTTGAAATDRTLSDLRTLLKR